MKDATIRLLFAGVLGILALLLTAVIIIIGIVRGLNPTDMLAISGPFASVTIASVTFFLGHTNGVSSTKETPPGGPAP